jgi:hypothetical protein
MPEYIKEADSDCCENRIGKFSPCSKYSDWNFSDIFSFVEGTDFKFAAPSWVIPGTILKNCEYLSGRIEEVCLLFFETESCLKYGTADLPDELRNKDLSYHTHLPLDLDWSNPVTEIFSVIEKLVNKVAFLDPAAHVLHPPVDSDLCRKVLPELSSLMKQSGMNGSFFLLENIKGNDLCDIVDVINECGFGICFDLGHYLSYSQDGLMDIPDLWDHVKMVHLNAPGEDSRHESLDMLDEKGVAVLDEVLGNVRPGTVFTIEVFEERGFVDSLYFLADRFRKNGGFK